MTTSFDQLGQQADRLENLVAGLAMPIPAQFHLDQLKEILPDISAEIKRFVVEQTGENPWSKP
jgi:hypothetical protein